MLASTTLVSRLGRQVKSLSSLGTFLLCFLVDNGDESGGGDDGDGGDSDGGMVVTVMVMVMMVMW